MTDELEPRLLELVSAVVGRRVGDATASWRSVGLDSLDLLSVVVTVEDAFGVEIPDLVAVRLTCVADIARMLRSATSSS